MNKYSFFTFLSILILICHSCKEGIGNGCVFPTYYGVATLAESSISEPWIIYEDGEELIFYKFNGDSIVYEVELETEVTLNRLLCQATCPEIVGTSWVEYDSEGLGLTLNPFLANPFLEVDPDKPGLVQLRLNSLITNFIPDSVQIVDVINISVFGLVGAGPNEIYSNRGSVAYDLRDNQELESYILHDEIEINGNLYEDVYQTLCNECSNEGVIFYNHDNGLIAFMGPDGAMWYKR